MLIIARGGFRARLSNSLGGPPGLHRGRKLRATFRRKIKFSLRFLNAARFLRAGRLR